MSQRTIDDPIAAAREALGRHAWHEAFDLLRKADAEGRLSARDLELLGEAAWWSGDMDACIAARERAYAAHVEAGEPLEAAMVAFSLVRDHGNRLDGALSSAWFRRAERLLRDQPESVPHGYLEMMRTRAAHNAGEFDRAVGLGANAVEMGMRFGDQNLQALALMYQGMAMVGRGDVEEGLALLDEATVAAVSGELLPNVTGMVYCNMISTCQELAEYRRAGEWTEAAKRWCDRQAISGFPGLCRVHRAEIIRLRGAWAEAEQEAKQACTELMDHGLPAFAGDGFYEVGEIRFRMGDLAAAEDAFRQANELGRDPQPGLALLRLAQGSVDAAASLIRRSLEEHREPLSRVQRLSAQVEIAVASGDVETADRAGAELEEIAGRYGSDALHAAAACARARVRLEQGQAADAIPGARRGWQLWRDLDAPYEAAMAREILGHAYRAMGDEETAVLELQAARSALEKLGAATDARRVTGLLGEDAASGGGRRVAKTFMFTDIVRSTNLVEAIGDEAWEDLVVWHDRILRVLFAEHRGEEVDHAGDGFFVAFEDPAAALASAVAIQRSLAEHRRTHGFAPQVRIGLHAAEATGRGGDYGGRGVHRAARIGGLAGAGEIVASAETVDAAAGSWEVSEARETTLKGFAEPARVVTVSWR
ncbi:MAG: adenylate/guanylate cyclase domain-containing protein [Actinomycetota bacterium]